VVIRRIVTVGVGLGFLVAAGCYQPSPPSGALLCSLDGQCPQGYHCTGGACWRNGEDPDAAMPFTQAPLLISPRNGAATGSVRAARARRPMFRWRALAEATSYEIQVDDSCDDAAFRSCTFPSPEASETATTASLRLSAGLAVSSGGPAGRRYYWRVRGCGGSLCTPWSEVRYLDVARNTTDFTGDGDSDLVIGNAGASVNGVADVGSAYVANGVRVGLPGMQTMLPPGGAFGDQYGNAAASAGDVDGDGYADLVISAEVASQAGRVHLYLGGASWPNAAPSQILQNPEGQTVAFFGHALAAGDLNGDGRSDLIVGAEIQDGTSVASDGKVFIYPGGTPNTGIAAMPAVTLENPARQEQGYFGHALAIGDFDGDGYADLAVAASKQDAIGRVFIYRGGPAGVATSPAATLDDPTIVTNAAFGDALVAGDFDGDGYADLAVGAAQEDTGGKPGVGHVYVFHGGPDGIANRAAPWRTLDNPSGQMSSLYGWALAAADFNADDIDDLVVSATYQDTAAGRVYVYQGAAAGLPAQPSRTLNDPTPASANDFFGYVLAVGDRAPGDGFADLFVGAVRGAGVIYLLDGSAGGLPATTTTATTITGAGVPGGDLGPSSLSSASP
jgi:hypothetical protein